MIRVESITIQEFRGIRELTLELKGTNFAICGPNGTGKSGVVDALEFALTGNISRLSGEGKGDISLKAHGPHVDKRDEPAKAKVTIKCTAPSIAQTFTIERCVTSPTKPVVAPVTPAISKIVRALASHPELVLSRREIIRYVLATPGRRAEEVQSLLQLNSVEQVRTVLQKVANKREKQADFLKTTASTARQNFCLALGVEDSAKEQLLAVVNAKREMVGLPLYKEWTSSTSIRDGLTEATRRQGARIAKKQALIDLAAARDAVGEVKSEATASQANDITEALSALENDPAIEVAATLEHFYTTGLELAEEEACPFCDTEWNLNDLTNHVKAKLNRLSALSEKRKQAAVKIAPLIATIRTVSETLERVTCYAVASTPPTSVQALQAHVASCKLAIERLDTLFPLSEAIVSLRTITTVSDAIQSELQCLEAAVGGLPEPSTEDAARDWLVICQERLDVWREAEKNYRVASEQARLARQIYEIYSDTSDRVLAGIYGQVEKDFAYLYRAINRDDEGEFKAQLVPSMGKLGFDVDFYGRGFFPPGAYHSEGHQDGMGLCLYLALMKHLHGNLFTIAVLDDVVMSVDVGHRREVCSLLKKQFPNTQFVLTTHDPVWLRHMATECLIGGKVVFKDWCVEHGPTQWEDRDIWSEIDGHLGNNDVRGASAFLRHYLEYVSAELCDRLKAAVGLRGDGQYQLGELLPAAIGRLRKLYKSAKSAASSWNQRNLVQELEARERAFTQCAASSNVEQWQINASVHYNSWANLAKQDFKPVAEAFEGLLKQFECSDCGEYLRVSPDRETPESLRCGCGKTNLNLCAK
jgi:ABC-type cobalamin/Fe3+-siderophores transport system ATPase subunit